MRRPLILHIAVYGFFLLVAVIVTYPLITQLSTALVGYVNGDGYEMAHHIWWFTHAIQTGQPLFYQPLLAYPTGLDGITLWTDPLQFFPAWLFAFALPLASAANLTLLLTLALNGWAMFFLAKYLIGAQRAAPLQPLTLAPSPTPAGRGEKANRANAPPLPTERGLGGEVAPALLAGLVFMLAPVMQGHLGAGHAGLLVQWPLPIYVYALLRLRERGGGRGIALAVICFFLSVAGYTLQLIYATLPVTLIVALLLIARRDWTALRRVVIAVVIGGALLGLFLIPVLRATLATYGESGGAVQYSADLLGVVTPSFLHPLFGQLAYTHQVLGLNLDEGTAYVGLIAAILCLIALWKVRASRWWLALALLVWILSLGPLLKVLDQPVTFSVDGYASYVTLPFALIANLPLIRLARTPGRFDFALALAVAALAGYGAAYLWTRVRLSAALKYAGLALLMAGIAFEYQVFWPLPLTPAAIPQPIADLSQRSDLRAVFDVPWGNFVTEQDGLYLQTAHEHPLIAGHVTRGTPVSPAKLTLLQDTLDPALLRAAGADVVIVHRDQDDKGAVEARARQQLGKPLYEDAHLALFLTPPSAAAPAFTALPADPSAITSEADSYVYAPQDGWVTFSADLSASGAPRDVALLLDGVVAGRWTVNGSASVSLPLPVSAASFQTIGLALDPACPLHFDPALECRSVALADVNIEYTPAPASAAVTFDHGVTLARSFAPASAQPGGSLPVWLWWQFGQAINTDQVRFVHLLDASGQLVAQQDNPLGVIAAGETRAEAVSLALPADLPPGAYTVSVGWYSYPDISDFRVLSSGENALTVGTVTVK